MRVRLSPLPRTLVPAKRRGEGISLIQTRRGEMKRKSFQRPGERPRGWQETLALLIAATLIVIGFWGAATAATCTGSSFNGSGFTLSDTTGVGQGTISVSGRDGDFTSVSVTITFS